VLNPYLEESEYIFKIQGDIPVIKNANYIAEKIFEEFKPEKVHIATEGSLGLATRQYCRRNRIPYNRSYHTRLAEYG
jgi:CMP-2-keto-3-deoxyoctulosonic acid synthetase